MKQFIKSKECFISFAVALIPAFVLWIFEPTKSIPFWAFAMVFILAFIFLWLFLMVYFTKSDNNEPFFIDIIKVYGNLFVCRPNKLLNQDVFVSFFKKNNEFEILIGYGYVSNIQTNGIIQITPLEAISPHTIEELFSFNLSDIIIKPTVTTSYLSPKIIEKEPAYHEEY